MQAPSTNSPSRRFTPGRALALQQLVLIGGLGCVMAAARALTGRNLRGLQDAPQPVDLLLYAATVAALVYVSWRIARHSAAGARLGLGLDWGRAGVAVLGFGIGAFANALPWGLALLLGDAVVTARAELAAAQTLPAVALGLVLAWANAWFEEATSRAAPLTILREWPAWRAVGVSALCFALMHGIGEVLDPLRCAYLAALGVVFGAAFMWQGHVWLGTGLHAGWFWASLVPSGRLEGGALLALRGNVGVYVMVSDLLLIAAALLLLWRLARTFSRRDAAPER